MNLPVAAVAPPVRLSHTRPAVLYCALLLSQFTRGSAVGEQPSPEGQEAVVSVGEQVGPKLTPVPLERRKARLALTPCKNCGSPHTAVTLRIEFFV
jgi:hypothetical protein